MEEKVIEIFDNFTYTEKHEILKYYNHSNSQCGKVTNNTEK